MNVWTNEELNFLKENYKQYTKKELAEMLNKTPNAIQIKANRLGLKKDEKYHYDKQYFKDITEPNQAYWLGFIYADGYISANKNKTKYSVGIELQKSDYKHLQNFNIDIKGNVQVTYRKRKSHYINQRLIGETELCQIRLYCTEMAKDLERHGCCLNKSLIKDKPKNIPESLMRNFIRGYFDGNGTICYSINKKVNKSYLKVSIETGSENFALWLSDYLNQLKYYNYISKDKSCYKLQLNANSRIDFLKYLYDESEIYLKRKYDKYIDAVYGESDTDKP
jgi:hypothetical protein